MMSVSWTFRLPLLAVLTALGMLVAPAGQAQTSASSAKSASARPASGSGHLVLYASTGPEVAQYDVDIEGFTLNKRGSVTLPANVVESAAHPSRKYLYVAWGNPKSRGVSAFRIDPTSGALLPHGEPATLSLAAFHITVDLSGTNLLISHTQPRPGGVSVYRIAPDGSLGPEVKPPTPLSIGVRPHEVHVVQVDPSNQVVMLASLGNHPPQKIDPGMVKLLNYKDGVLTDRGAISPGGGIDFHPRAIAVHPSGKWVFAGLEDLNKLHVFAKLKDGTFSNEPLFVKDTLREPNNVRPVQMLGAVNVHPNGKFVYVLNRARGITKFEGQEVFTGGENTIAVYAINQSTGEPTLVETPDSRGIFPRSLTIDPSGRMFVAANQETLAVRDGKGVRNVLPSLAIFRVRNDGKKLEFVRKYDFDADTMRVSKFISLP